MTIDAVARLNGDVLARSWALNEVAVEKGSRERILEVVLEVDGRPVSAFGCDGVLCATPTGSTAYAFSAGGPLVWPQVEALLLWSGRRSRRCCWCRATRTRCSPGRW
jgi:NAD+ kinase